MGKPGDEGGAAGSPANDSSCNLSKVLMFVAALTAGTVCSLTSKMLLSMKSVGMTGEVEDFSYPLFQTTGMFLGMTAGLFFHFLVMWFRIPFPGYTHATSGYVTIPSSDEESAGLVSGQPGMKPFPTWMYFFLIFPSVFDLVATSLAMYGLRYVTVSVYQMLRGSAIVFVALLKQFVLKDVLKRYQWVGIALNVLSIVLVGLTAMMIEASAGASGEGVEGASSGVAPSEGTAAMGVALILMGAFVQSLQYVFEEKVMSASEDDPNVAPTPPLLLIGMEGLWGLLICVFVLYPLAYYYPGEDHGSFENPFNTYTMIANSSSVQAMFALYFCAILAYNVLACLVTFMLDSVWHAILDNFRPATVWGTDLFIFYFVTASFGESWNQPWSLLQLLGMAILLYGTAIYNAPNPGSILLKGGADSCFIDCSDEYEERLPVVLLAAPDTPLISGSKLGEVVVPSNPSPHYATMSPFLAGNQRRLMISPAQPGRAGAVSGAVGAAAGAPVGLRRRGDREDYVVVVGPGGAAAGRAPALSGNSSNLLVSQQLGRGMSFGYGTSNVVSGGSPGGVSMGYTNYGAR